MRNAFDSLIKPLNNMTIAIGSYNLKQFVWFFKLYKSFFFQYPTKDAGKGHKDRRIH